MRREYQSRELLVKKEDKVSNLQTGGMGVFEAAALSHASINLIEYLRYNLSFLWAKYRDISSQQGKEVDPRYPSRFSARSEATQCHSQSPPCSPQPSEPNASLGRTAAAEDPEERN
jgi:hypothetical protein